MADEAQTGLAGGCQCGAVRYRLEAKPKATSICHCRMCQKASGGPFAAFGGVRLGRLVWTRGAIRKSSRVPTSQSADSARNAAHR